MQYRVVINPESLQYRGHWPDLSWLCFRTAIYNGKSIQEQGDVLEDFFQEESTFKYQKQDDGSIKFGHKKTTGFVWYGEIIPL